MDGDFLENLFRLGKLQLQAGRRRAAEREAATAELHDALAYDFDDLKPDSTVVTLRWDKVAVPFKVAVYVNDIVTTLRGRFAGSINITGRVGTTPPATFLQTKSI